MREGLSVSGAHPLLALVSQSPRPRGSGRPLFAVLSTSYKTKAREFLTNKNLEDPNLLKLKSLDSLISIFLSDNSIWGQ